MEVLGRSSFGVSITCLTYLFAVVLPLHNALDKNPAQVLNVSCHDAKSESTGLVGIDHNSGILLSKYRDLAMPTSLTTLAKMQLQTSTQLKTPLCRT